MSSPSSPAMPTTLKHINLLDGNLFLVDEISHMKAEEEEHRRLDFFALVLCTGGAASGTINGEQIEVRKNDLLIGAPSQILSGGKTGEGFSCIAVCLSLDYAKRIFPHVKRVWDIKFLTEKTPVIHLSEDTARSFEQYFNLLCYKGSLATIPNENVINMLVLALIYDLEGAIKDNTSTITQHFTSAENLFRRFMEVLTTSQPKPRMVADYARELCITPKYLSSVCKEVSGHTASRMIDAYVLKDIEYQLKYTKKSVKEVSFDLGFPNISFFGKFVKKHFGCSPKEVREKHLQNNNTVV